MNSCLKVRQWKEALEIFGLLHDHRCCDTISLNVALKALSEVREWKTALDYLDDLKGVRTDMITYTAAIGACGEDQWQLAVEVFASLFQSALQADDMTYLALLSANRRWQQATSLMKTLSFKKASVPCSNMLLKVLCGGQQWRLVMHLFLKLAALDRICDRITHNIAMSAGTGSLQWQQCITFLKSMNERRIRKNCITFNTAMTLCNGAVQWTQSLSLTMDLESCGLQGDRVTPSLVFSAAGTRGWQDLLNVVEKMILEGGEEMLDTMDAAACNAALMAADDQWQVVIQLLHTFHNRKVERSIIGYSTAIGACSTEVWFVPLQLWQEAMRWRVQADAMALNVLLTTLSRGDQWPVALEMLREAAETSDADVISYNAARV